jgi:hypothetical protein
MSDKALMWACVTVAALILCAIVTLDLTAWRNY